jgi:hypothetical protein
MAREEIRGQEDREKGSEVWELPENKRLKYRNILHLLWRLLLLSQIAKG